VRAAKRFDTQVRNGKSWGTTHRFLLALFFLFLIVLPGVARPQAGPPSDRRQSGPSTIRVSVGLVVLHATVQNHKGNIVSGLAQGDFHVYENGVLQRITYFSDNDIPVTVGLVIDNSGSMEPKRSEVIAAGLAFARSSNPQDQMFVVNFNEHVRFALPDNTPFTDQPGQLDVALSRIKADGETALYDAIAGALEHLKSGDRNKKALIVMEETTRATIPWPRSLPRRDGPTPSSTLWTSRTGMTPTTSLAFSSNSPKTRVAKPSGRIH